MIEDAVRGGDRPGVEPGLVTVRLIGLPVELHARAEEHAQELRREFQLMAELVSEQVRDHRPVTVPQQLLQLMTVLSQRYSGFSADQEDVLAEAVRDRLPSLDLTFHVPPHASDAAVELGKILDAADAYCLEGRHLLTFATPPDVLAYRRWYLDEFVAQIAGADPAPWPAGRPLMRR